MKLTDSTNVPHLIEPHGGRLVNRVLEGAARSEALARAASLPKITVGEWEASDIELIAVGAVSPLEGFMTYDDYTAVVNGMHLSDGLPWTIPITLAVEEAFASAVKEGDDVAIYDMAGTLLAILHVRSKFRYHKANEAVRVYGTDDDHHPGVAALLKRGDVALGGPLDVVNLPPHADFQHYRLTPTQTREIFRKRGWRRVVGFQTRNPIHRAHEYMQKVAMEITDGLFLHPLVGKTKDDDVSADLRMRTYEVIVEKYYPRERVVIGVNPAAMRYAGPREAVFHALIRKNYGCSHFIVGRDHAGVGNYYGTFDAHYIFDNFDPQAIGITPLFFDYTFYCRACGNMASVKTCPHSKENHVTLSGTKVREMLSAGVMPPPEFTRPEVAQILIEGYAAAQRGAGI
ncbi:MAG: sulfate adenylyltransferase [Candidatus Sumerlaeaceae bacterium]|nr:sulfate adenylyltransferase [Candidatus Sumerlaeaceae bacterium]